MLLVRTIIVKSLLRSLDLSQNRNLRIFTSVQQKLQTIFIVVSLTS